jgi:hypothetical protein
VDSAASILAPVIAQNSIKQTAPISGLMNPGFRREVNLVSLKLLREIILTLAERVAKVSA